MNCHFSNIYFSIGSVVQWNGNSCLIFIDLHDIHYIQVGEAIPLSDASVDAVVGTLVLCSVTDVDQTLQGN